MNRQLTPASINDELSATGTGKKEFLKIIESIVPFAKWVSMIKSYYYKGERGNKPYDIELMLRIYILQNLYDLADMRIITEVIDGRVFSDFCGINTLDEVSSSHGNSTVLSCLTITLSITNESSFTSESILYNNHQHYKCMDLERVFNYYIDGCPCGNASE